MSSPLAEGAAVVLVALYDPRRKIGETGRVILDIGDYVWVRWNDGNTVDCFTYARVPRECIQLPEEARQ